jgi:hypothetical protein
MAIKENKSSHARPPIPTTLHLAEDRKKKKHIPIAYSVHCSIMQLILKAKAIIQKSKRYLVILVATHSKRNALGYGNVDVL